MTDSGATGSDRVSAIGSGDASYPAPAPNADSVGQAAKALALCQQLRETLDGLKLYGPAYYPFGQSPSAADACAQLLQMLEHGIQRIEVFVGHPSYWTSHNVQLG